MRCPELEVSKPKWKGVSFDFDGTICCMEPPVHQTIGTILRRHGIPGKTEEIARVLRDKSSLPVHPFMKRRGWGTLTEEEKKEVLKHRNLSILKRLGITSNLDFLANAINDEWFATRELYPDVPEAFRQLQQMGMAIAIVAGPSSAAVKGVLKRYRLLEYVVCFATSDVVSTELGPLRKQDGTAYQYALAQMQLKPSEALHVGDNVQVDGDVPKNLGVTPILINRNQREDLRRAAKRHIVISNMQQLLKIIKS